jgi:hypothetical protein
MVKDLTYIIQELLSQQTDKHAVVFLKDVAFSDLKSLVDFMYRYMFLPYTVKWS